MTIMGINDDVFRLNLSTMDSGYAKRSSATIDKVTMRDGRPEAVKMKRQRKAGAVEKRSKRKLVEGHVYNYPRGERVLPLVPEKFAIEKVKMVTRVDQLKEVVSDLNRQVEFAVDVEHHISRRYEAKTCLIQISTRATDYVIDTLQLWKHVHLLEAPLGNERIRKVFHCANNDMMWLHRDFGLEVKNLFDTQKAMIALGFARKGLQYLVKSYCGFLLDKKHQKSDWSIRPLPKDMVDYAAQDTHHLLYCYDQLKNELIDRGLLEHILKASDAVTREREGAKESFLYGGEVFEGWSEWSIEQKNLAMLVFDATEDFAARHDVRPVKVIPANFLEEIVNEVMRILDLDEVSGLSASCYLLPKGTFYMHRDSLDHAHGCTGWTPRVLQDQQFLLRCYFVEQIHDEELMPFARQCAFESGKMFPDIDVVLPRQAGSVGYTKTFPGLPGKGPCWPAPRAATYRV
ncbi:hypothetical protein QR680_013639 [Steinernema hermaphroditum]|uniref:3'-5' exonuclease domain-containing protein n=1 Tax=Steinernema hermaphroditum TaxID=289476 RepID=A0AA39I893_9BILA|nr:hypothetical protein QR680_013639 [Steinernema hermaphroditum]